MKMQKVTTYALLGGMGVVTLSAIMVASAGASSGPESEVRGEVVQNRVMKRGHYVKGQQLLDLFDLNKREYIDLLREDISLREYAESENLNLEEITAEAESKMIDRLDRALEDGKLTEDEYDEKLRLVSENLEAHLDAEDLEDLPRFEKRLERREGRQNGRRGGIES